MSTSRNQSWQMAPSISLIVGYDHYQPTYLEVESPAELLELLSRPWAEWYRTKMEANEHLRERIIDAVREWNSCFAAEDGPASPSRWKWLGLHIIGKGETARFSCTLDQQPTAEVCVQTAAIEGACRQALSEIQETAARALGGSQ